MRNLINIIKEAEVKPGERKDISFKVNRLDKMLKKLNAYKKNVQAMSGMDIPDSAKAELESVISKVNDEINKVQTAYDSAKSRMGDSSNTPIKMTNFFNGLLKNCKQILAVYKTLNANEDNSEQLKFLFRGIKGQNSDALYGKPFLDRKPKDSPKSADMLFNMAMKNAGFEARRDNSSFVSGNDSHAGGYGNLYIMFPVDGFNFTWSKKYDDLVLPSDFAKAAMINKPAVTKLKKEFKKLSTEAQYDLKWNYNVVDHGAWGAGLAMQNVAGLKNALKDGKIPDEFGPLLDEVFNQDAITKSIESYDLTNDNLVSAIMSNHEIYISGPYYAIKDTNANRKRLMEFLSGSGLADTDAPASAGKIGTKHVPGEIVKILSGPYENQTGTVVQWAGAETKLFVDSSTGYKMIMAPSDDLETIDANVKNLPKAGDLVLVRSKNKIATVASVYNPLSIYVRFPNSWSSVETKKHDIEKIDTSKFTYAPGDKAIVITSDYYGSSDYGKMIVVTKATKTKVIGSKITKTGKVSKISEEYPVNVIIPANSQLAMTLFPKLATPANVEQPAQQPDVHADIIAKLEPKIKTGSVTYADIDFVAQNLDYDPDTLIAMLEKQGVKVNPLNTTGSA